ncbi:T9SS C-terminal target domain-containing protein [Flavobacterium sp. MAH-1]|uniref:T9SS C-terminal target domain-containing protein n=1 Tax=Flavobacterium agri TaxID=2743471 RepID=A0A7Y9C6A8_9FLAO|nr:T9SS C-terminal target domain-containing protein [Flavobacterium agri]NUY82187.1 T9SS C-terminal target domain-containing protein [Flavobacterium agri]NYA72211.1 T9SS C-terminal target domain-containing protein [Flavobacterium agri]
MRQLLMCVLFPVLVFAQPMQKRCVKPLVSIKLPSEVSETSGLTVFNGQLLTHNDSGKKPILYSLDTLTGKIGERFGLPVKNFDWEEISSDSLFIYIADIGNNHHARDRLYIYRLRKKALSERRIELDSIGFSWPEEHLHDSIKKRNYNCEAFVVSRDSIYLFTKEKHRTGCYSIGKSPGFYTAKFQSEFKSKVRITGAFFDENKQRLVLCGYNGLLRTFLLDFTDFSNNAFFSGKVTRYRLRKAFRQTEGITTFNGRDFYLSNEHFLLPWIISRKQELHLVRLE